MQRALAAALKIAAVKKGDMDDRVLKLAPVVDWLRQEDMRAPSHRLIEDTRHDCRGGEPRAG